MAIYDKNNNVIIMFNKIQTGIFQMALIKSNFVINKNYPSL